MNWIVRVKDSFPARNVLGKRVCEAWLDACHARVRCQSCQWEPMTETWNCHGFSCHLSLILEAPKRELMRTMDFRPGQGPLPKSSISERRAQLTSLSQSAAGRGRTLKKRTVEVENQKTMGPMGWYGMLFDMSHEFLEVLRSCLILGLCF